ncbi:MAG: hypothetical protein GC156_11795 [Actinomycetales bacterium]|nr:hypothetical protein [Actinomycetales bacterium]
MRSFLREVGPVPTLIVFCTWVVAVFRSLPIPVGDFGLYVSVSERLLAGDRLYVDVFENKDPLFHYLLAVFRYPTPFGAWLLEVMTLAAASLAVVWIARGVGIRLRVAVVIGLACSPWIITGWPFYAGVSELPGIALVLWVAAVALRARWVVGGLLLGVLAFYKLIMLPIGVVVLLIAVVVRRDWRGVLLGGAAAAGAGAGVVALLAVRGELLPYLETLSGNAAYANDVQDLTVIGGLFQHLRNVLDARVALSLVGSLLLVGLGLLWRNSPLRQPGSAQRELLWFWIGTMTAGVGVLSLTGLWIHHALVLTPSLLLSLVIVGGALSDARGRFTPLLIAALAGGTWLLAGAPSPSIYTTPIEYARAQINLQTMEPDQSRLIAGTGPPSSYARVGQADDDGSARGLRDWSLACRRFFQAFYDSESLLSESLRCLPGAQVILVDRDARPVSGATAWNSYLDGVEDILTRYYRCTDADGIRVCVKSSQSSVQPTVS